MEEPIIKIENISKKFQINVKQGKYLTLRDSLIKFIKNPFLIIKKKDEFWALKNINFNINRGEAVGIIGANGAGKSTILKILSRITPPTEGRIEINGRVSSLLEVGTGFNQELSGRENIYLNGAILGMSKKEIEEKMEKIIEFAGVEKFIDTPIKYYSSGMSVRLAFSVAAHLDPDILIVDEVLAVGDADFQKKCLGKMDEVVKKSGRTIIFVSHNMDAIRDLCPKSILLKKGEVAAIGETNEVINKYLSVNHETAGNNKLIFNNSAENGFKLLSCEIKSDKKTGESFRSSADIFVELEFELEKIINNLCVGFELYDEHHILVFRSYNTDANENAQPKLNIGKNTLRITIPGGILNAGTYFITPSVHIFKVKWLIKDENNKIFFNIYFDHSDSQPLSIINSYPASRPGIICPILKSENITK